MFVVCLSVCVLSFELHLGRESRKLNCDARIGKVTQFPRSLRPGNSLIHRHTKHTRKYIYISPSIHPFTRSARFADKIREKDETELNRIGGPLNELRNVAKVFLG